MCLVAYYRVSTDRQGRSGLGLEAQKFAVEAHAKSVNLPVSASFTEVESGRKPNRPQLAEAIRQARALGATLVVAKLDRLSRDTRTVLSLLDGGVPIKFLDLPDIGSDPITSRLLLTVMAAFAEFESRRIGQRIKEAVARRKAILIEKGEKEKKKVFGESHQKHANRRRHELDRAEAERFRREHQPLIRGLRLTMTLQQIADELNKRGVPTRHGVKWTFGLVHHFLKEIDFAKSKAETGGEG